MASPLDALLTRFANKVEPGIVAEVFAQCGGDTTLAAHVLLPMAGDDGRGGGGGGGGGVNEAAVAEAELRAMRTAAAAAEEEEEAWARADWQSQPTASVPSAAPPPPPPPPPLVRAHHPPPPPSNGLPVRERQYWPPAGVPPAQRPPPPPVAEFSSLFVGHAHHRAAPEPLPLAWADDGPGRAGAPPAPPEPAPIDPVALSFLCDLFAGVGPGLVRDILAMAGGEVGPAVEALADVVGGGSGGGGGGFGDDGDADLVALLADLGAGGAPATPGAEPARRFGADPLAELFPDLHPAALADARAAAGGDDAKAAELLAATAEFHDRLDQSEADAAVAARLAAECEAAASRAAGARAQAEQAASPEALAALAARFPDMEHRSLVVALHAAGPGGVDMAASILADAAGLDAVPPDPDAGWEAVAVRGRAPRKAPPADKGKAPVVGTPPVPTVANGRRASTGAGSSGSMQQASLPIPRQAKPAPAAAPASSPSSPSLATSAASAPAIPAVAVADRGFGPAASAVPAPARPPPGRPPPPPPPAATFATGEDAYGALRPKIQRLQAHFKRLSVQAMKAFKDGNRAVAERLKAELRLVEAALKQAQADVVRQTLRTTNAGRLHVNEMDVHYMHVPEAVAVVGMQVCHLMSSPAHHMAIDQTQAFICGKGNRSYDGVAKLAPALVELMAGAGVPHELVAGGGRLLVTIPGAGEGGWDGARSRAAKAALMAAVTATGVKIGQIFPSSGVNTE